MTVNITETKTLRSLALAALERNKVINKHETRPINFVSREVNDGDVQKTNLLSSDLCEERATIMEYDGVLSREDAEERALNGVILYKEL